MNKSIYLKAYTIIFAVTISISLIILIPFYVNNIGFMYNQLPLESRESTLAGSAVHYAPFSWSFGALFYYLVLLEPFALPFLLFFLIHSLWILAIEWNRMGLSIKTTSMGVIVFFLIVHTLQFLNWSIIGLWLVD